jgi:hypothetical protein
MLVQCFRCGRMADRVSILTKSGPLCRFCQSEIQGRCLLCGAPGKPWPYPEPRLTMPVPNYQYCASSCQPEAGNSAKITRVDGSRGRPTKS